MKIFIKLTKNSIIFLFVAVTIQCVAWSEQQDSTFRIVYNGNGNTAGKTPIDTQQNKYNKAIMILGNAGNLMKTGFSFSGWNTEPDGGGTTYQAGETIDINDSEITLFAKWTINRYFLTMTIDGNGKAFGSDSVTYGIAKTIIAKPDSGYHFSKWRVLNGTAKIEDSTSDSTVIVMQDGDVTVQSIFHLGYTFRKVFGGEFQDEGNSVQQTKDGGYVITGYTNSIGAGGDDVFLLKVNAAGDSEWTRTFGGPKDDRGLSVKQTKDGGYIITGYTWSFGAGRQDIYLVKTDTNGHEIWAKTFGDTGIDQGYAIAETNDGGIILGGNICDYGVLIKTNAIGNVSWIRKYYKEGYWCCVGNVEQTSDEGYVLLLKDGGHYLDSLIKVDANGFEIWSKEFYAFYAGNAQQTIDRGYMIIIGDFNLCPSPYSCGICLIKTDSYGDSIWTKTFCIRNALNNCAVQQTKDGGYIVISDCYPGYSMLKTDKNGEEEWYKDFGLGKSFTAYAIQQTSDGGYIIAGSGSSNFQNSLQIYIIKTDETGHFD
jgi:hypothetical protein